MTRTHTCTHTHTHTHTQVRNFARIRRAYTPGIGWLGVGHYVGACVVEDGARLT